MPDVPAPGPTPSTASSHRLRLWRVRHRQNVIDAEISPGAGAGVELRLAYNGQVVYRRGWASRDDAVREAAARRAGLERAGWTRHW